MFCREQVASLLPHAPAFAAMGATFALIGQGTVAQARDFAEQFVPQGSPVRVLTDPERAAYTAAGLHRNALAVLRPTVLARGARAFAEGHRQGALAGDPWLHGGAFVIGADGKPRFEQRSESPGDHADFQDLLAAARHAILT